MASRSISPLLSLVGPATSRTHFATRFRRSHRLSQSRIQSALQFSLAIPAIVRIGLEIPSLLQGLWEGILRAVPKKKTSHRKKRQRFMAGKALKDVVELNKCSACGNTKRAHRLCEFCVAEIKGMWRKGPDVNEQRREETKTQKAAEDK